MDIIKLIIFVTLPILYFYIRLVFCLFTLFVIVYKCLFFYKNVYCSLQVFTTYTLVYNLYYCLQSLLFSIFAVHCLHFS